MITEVNVSFKLESLRPIPDADLTARIHELLLDEESETENFMGQECDHYALLMPDIEVEVEAM